MADLEKLETVLREVLSEQFSGVVFDSVRIREGTDHDDDAVLFVRHLRPHLRGLGEDRFPIMSFVSREDLAEHEALNA